MEIYHASFCSSIDGKGLELHVRIFTVVADGAPAYFRTGLLSGFRCHDQVASTATEATEPG